MKKVIIGGGSGLIGRTLTELLTRKGYEVAWLSRSSKEDEVEVVQWDPLKGHFPAESIREYDHFINLAGAGIADKKWSSLRKKLIIDSRVIPNQLFAEAMREERGNIQSYISSSAIGYYGDSGQKWVNEETKPDANGFLHKSCQAWEDAIQEVKDTGITTSWLRTGIVLSLDGGALEKMLPPLKMGVSGYFGSGEQYYSWIHIQDMASLFVTALEERWEGPYNAVAPDPVPMKEFAKQLADAAPGRQLVLPVPAFGLKIAFGEMSSVLLNSNRVSSEKVTAEGFRFQYPKLQLALSDLLNSTS